ncbi:SDR family NAD(P)-dependent oxidoreductase [Pararhodobacter sp.]|uniref:SDR family NAD(P)-dependent oxidoreductase n=1 Tax=Pararhodobacter sp. TaxID=2127056 RepID=UPI002FDCE999
MSQPVAVITGGANGIGKAAVVKLTGAGWKVIVADLNHSSLVELKDQLPDIEIRELDVLKEAQIVALADQGNRIWP